MIKNNESAIQDLNLMLDSRKLLRISSGNIFSSFVVAEFIMSLTVEGSVFFTASLKLISGFFHTFQLIAKVQYDRLRNGYMRSAPRIKSQD